MFAFRSVIVVLAVLVAGWFVFDGSLALVAGDYVTPRSGEWAGQVGPWGNIVAAVGIEPRSTLMKTIFVAYGAAWIGVIVAFVRGAAWAWWGMLAAAVGSQWYLPFGTVLGVAQAILLVLPGVRHPER